MALNNILPVDLKIAIPLFLVGYVAYKLFNNLFLYPHFTSPMLNMPGPRGSPWSLSYLLHGEDKKSIHSETTAVQIEWAKQYGQMIRLIGMLGKEKAFVLSPTALQKVYVTDWLDYPRLERARLYTGLIAGFGLLTNHGEEHRAMRRFMNPAFSMQNLYAQTEMYYNPAYGMVEVLREEVKSAGKEGKVVNMYELITKCTLDIICATAFGHISDAVHNPKDELAEAYHNFSLQTTKVLIFFIAIMALPGCERFFSSPWPYKYRHIFRNIPGLAFLEEYLSNMNRVKVFAAAIVKQRIAEAQEAMDSGGSIKGKKDVMSLLIQARMREEGEAGYRMSDEEMVEQVLTFLGAGHDTTATGASWCIWLLANHPDVQERLRAEIAPVFANKARPDYKTLTGLEYLDHVVMESLRVFPPIPMTARQASKSDYVDGYYVPQGTWLLTPTVLVNTLEGYWGKDAAEFRPERWTSLPKASTSNYFQTFSVGPHHCVGKTMGIAEMKAMVAVLISNYEFEPSYPGQVPKPSHLITMRPSDGLPLRVRPIETSL